MKTRFNTSINHTLFILFSLVVFAALPAQAGTLPYGAKCINGVVVKPHYGPPGKGTNWMPSRTKCEAVDFAAMEVAASGKVREDSRRYISHGAPGKPGYSWQYQNANR